MENIKFRVTDDLLASQGQRFGNYAIDFIIQYALVFILGILFALFATIIGSTSLLFWLENMSRIEEYLIGIVILVVYYTITETYFSRSIGKLVTKTIVVNIDGSKPDSSKIIKRSLCRLIPFDGLTFLRTPSRGWHDSISETYVVRKEDFERQKDLFYSFEEIGTSDN